MRVYHRSLVAIVGLILLVAACAGPVAGAAPNAVARSAGPGRVAGASLAPTAVATAGSSASGSVDQTGNGSPVQQGNSSSMVTYNLVSSGTKADFRVREQLARLSFPSDAVGTTTAVTGSIALGADGKVIAAQSKFVVDLTSLRSDSANRDRYIQRNTLDTTRYPSAVFVPTEITGLPSPLPSTGNQTFQLTGNLTLHGVTRPVTWTVTSQVNGNDIVGQATTDFKFEDFGMSPPHVAAVLSVKDDVKLELTFHFVRSAS